MLITTITGISYTFSFIGDPVFLWLIVLMIQRDQSLSPKDQRFILHRPVGEKRVGDFVNVVFPTGCIVCGLDEAASVLISGYDGVLGTQASD